MEQSVYANAVNYLPKLQKGASIAITVADAVIDASTIMDMEADAKAPMLVNTIEPCNSP